MKCYRTLNTGLCLRILTDEIIFDAITEDGFKVENFVIDVMKDCWVEIVNDNEVIGVASFKQMYNKCYDTHIHVLPEHRTQSKEAGAALWEWIEENMTGCLIYTAVPCFCDSVRGFLLSFEFKEIGVLEKAWFKNNKQNDMWILTKRAG